MQAARRSKLNLLLKTLDPGNMQGQAGQGSEQTNVVEDVPAHCKEGWTR